MPELMYRKLLWADLHPVRKAFSRPAFRPAAIKNLAKSRSLQQCPVQNSYAPVESQKIRCFGRGFYL